MSEVPPAVVIVSEDVDAKILAAAEAARAAGAAILDWQLSGRVTVGQMKSIAVVQPLVAAAEGQLFAAACHLEGRRTLAAAGEPRR